MPGECSHTLEERHAQVHRPGSLGADPHIGVISGSQLGDLPGSKR
jgi:hypothetical protein